MTKVNKRPFLKTSCVPISAERARNGFNQQTGSTEMNANQQLGWFFVPNKEFLHMDEVGADNMAAHPEQYIPVGRFRADVDASLAWNDKKQKTLNEWFLDLPAERQAVLTQDKWMLAGAAFDAGLKASL